MVHAKRKLYEVHLATGPAAGKEALERITALFAIEAEIRGRAPPERHAARQLRAVAILEDLKGVLDTTLTRASATSSLAGAIRYATTRWAALTRHTTDGRHELRTTPPSAPSDRWL